MDRLKILICLLGLIIMPIICNLVMLLIFPIYTLVAVFHDDSDFYESLQKYKDNLAKFDYE